jgi:hypothetical protein
MEVLLMKKNVIALILATYLTSIGGTVYASGATTIDLNQYNQQVNEAVALGEKEIEDSAGILPNSYFYSIELGIEKLQLAITKSQEKLAALKAELATERAAEAVIMANEGEEELASEAVADYMDMLASAAEHINNAIEAKDEAVQTLETLNESYKKSEQILKSVLEKAPEESKLAIENALNQQDKAIAAVNGFYAAKAAFFDTKKQLEEVKKKLEVAKKSGDAAAISAAEEKVKAAETLKDELEQLKDAADSAKEEVKHLAEQAEERVKLGLKQIEKANDKIEKVEEKASENKEKLEEKEKKVDEKSKEEAKKAEEKVREEAKKADEKSREVAKKEEEKLREEKKKAEEIAREEAKKVEEKAREEVQKAEEKNRN